jgi:hypothetical protein
VPVQASPPRSARRAARIQVTAVTEAASASQTQLSETGYQASGMYFQVNMGTARPSTRSTNGTGAAVSPSNGGPSDVVSAS